MTTSRGKRTHGPPPGAERPNTPEAPISEERGSPPAGRRNEPAARRNETAARAGESPSARSESAAGRMPDLVRRVLGLGFSSFFMTEEVLRKALGDNLPREWVDFAAQQSDRTRRDLIERVAAEIGRSLDGVDLTQLLERLVRGHTVEVTARVRLVSHTESARAPGDEAADTGDPEGLETEGRRSHRVTVTRDEDS